MSGATHGIYTLQNVNHLYEFRDNDYYIIIREATTDGSNTIDVDLTDVVREGASVYYEVLQPFTVGGGTNGTAYHLDGDEALADYAIGNNSPCLVKIYELPK